MKNLLSLFLFTHICAAIAVHGRHVAPALKVRADDDGDPMDTDDTSGQQLIDPDDEGDHVDDDTLARTPKSKILKFDTAQEETDNRWFDWDQTCADETDRQKVLAAFQDGYEFANRASGFLQGLLNGLPNNPPGRNANKDNIAYIVKEDPAFAQMFYAQDNRIAQVKGTFDNLVAKMKSYQGRNTKRENADGVRIVCDREGKVEDVNGESYCGTGETAAQARTYNAVAKDFIEPQYDFDHSASIVFCPLFFDDEKFPNSFAIAGDAGNSKQLDEVDSRERIMVHEWLHLEFTSDIGSEPDEIGFERAAKIAGKGSPRKADWANASKNCDNYAWYAIYAYWNNNGGACKQDVWPEGVTKPNKPK